MEIIFLDNWPRASILVHEIFNNDTCMGICKGNNIQINNLEFFSAKLIPQYNLSRFKLSEWVLKSSIFTIFEPLR